MNAHRGIYPYECIPCEKVGLICKFFQRLTLYQDILLEVDLKISVKPKNLTLFFLYLILQGLRRAFERSTAQTSTIMSSTIFFYDESLKSTRLPALKKGTSRCFRNLPNNFLESLEPKLAPGRVSAMSDHSCVRGWSPKMTFQIDQPRTHEWSILSEISTH